MEITTEGIIGIIAVIFVSLIWLILIGFATDVLRRRNIIGVMTQTILLCFGTIILSLIAYYSITIII